MAFKFIKRSRSRIPRRRDTLCLAHWTQCLRGNLGGTGVLRELKSTHWQERMASVRVTAAAAEQGTRECRWTQEPLCFECRHRLGSGKNSLNTQSGNGLNGGSYDGEIIRSYN